MGCPSMQLPNGPAGSSAALICLAAIVALTLPAESWPSLAASQGGSDLNQQQPINTTQQVSTGYVQTRPFQWSTFGVLPNVAAAKAQLSPQQPAFGVSGNAQTRPDLLVESSAAGTRFRRETEVGSSSSNSSSEIRPKKRPKGKKPTGKVYPQQSEMECWEAHNIRRREHGVIQLDWDVTLAAQAQKHSNWMANTGQFVHSHVKGYGENIAWDSRIDAPCREMIDRWYKEIDLYSYNNPTFSTETGHFTQMVWRTTKKVGCAFARGKVTYLTCNYDPSGNWIGEFRQNVPPPLTRPQDVEKPKEPAKPVVPVSPVSPVSPVAVATTTTTTARPVTTTTLTSVYPSSVTPLPNNNDKEASTTKPKSKKKKKKSNKKKGDKDKKKKGNKKKNKKKKKKSSSTTTTPAPAPVADTATAGGRRSQVVDTTSAPGSISS